jgi:uncharacterized protein (UPF0548 family)
VFLRTKPSDVAIRDFLACQAQSRFSYPSVGVSILASAPAGHVTDRSRIRLGYGEPVWQQAVTAINNWQMFKMSWLQLCWPDAPIVTGTNVAVLIQHFGFWSLNASRIVYIVREDSNPIKRYGFAYGTLLDHGESGEERFLVERHSQDNSVWYDLFAFSRTRAIAARLGYPLARWLQRRFREDSKAAMARAVA